MVRKMRNRFCILLFAMMFLLLTASGTYASEELATVPLNNESLSSDSSDSLEVPSTPGFTTNPLVLELSGHTQASWNEARQGLLQTGITPEELATISDEELLLILENTPPESQYVRSYLIESSSNLPPNRTSSYEDPANVENQLSVAQIQRMDEKLLRAQTPEDVIASLMPEEKLQITRSLTDESVYVPAILMESVIYDPAGAFSSAELPEPTWPPTFEVIPDAWLTFVKPQADITKSEMHIEVKSWKTGDQVSIYPSFEWKVPRQPRGKDYFGYSTSDSYSAVPGERSNLLWSKMDADDDWGWPDPMDYSRASLQGMSTWDAL